jgi:hypothetical protein
MRESKVASRRVIALSFASLRFTRSTEGCSMESVGVGFTAMRITSSSPQEMPPWMPPARFVRNRMRLPFPS